MSQAAPSSGGDLEYTQRIQAPLPVVWTTLAELENWPQWTPTMLSVVALEQRAVQTGSRFRVRQPGLPPAIWQITDWRPEHGFSWISRGPGFSMLAEHALVADGTACLLSLRLRYGGLLGPVLRRLTAGVTRDYLRQEAEGLRTRAEAAARHDA